MEVVIEALVGLSAVLPRPAGKAVPGILARGILSLKLGDDLVEVFFAQ